MVKDDVPFSGALFTPASIPEAPRSLALASPRSGAPSSLASGPLAASASRKESQLRRRYTLVLVPARQHLHQTPLELTVPPRQLRHQRQHLAVAPLRQKLAQDIEHRPALLPRLACARRGRVTHTSSFTDRGLRPQTYSRGSASLLRAPSSPSAVPCVSAAPVEPSSAPPRARSLRAASSTHERRSARSSLRSSLARESRRLRGIAVDEGDPAFSGRGSLLSCVW
jgi:hypothetical protein